MQKTEGPSKHRRPVDLGQTQNPGKLVLEGILETLTLWIYKRDANSRIQQCEVPQVLV